MNFAPGHMDRDLHLAGISIPIRIWSLGVAFSVRLRPQTGGPRRLVSISICTSLPGCFVPL